MVFQMAGRSSMQPLHCPFRNTVIKCKHNQNIYITACCATAPNIYNTTSPLSCLFTPDSNSLQKNVS